MASPALIRAAGGAPLHRQVIAGTSEGLWRTFGKLVTFGRYCALLVVLLLVSYGWFGDDWFGTLKDVSTIIVWAFGLDLTAEAVLQAATRNPAPLAGATVVATDPTVAPPPPPPPVEGAGGAGGPAAPADDPGARRDEVDGAGDDAPKVDEVEPDPEADGPAATPRPTDQAEADQAEADEDGAETPRAEGDRPL
jgi:hypothetical protein